MAILLLADIHSNLEALNAVRADAEARGPVDAVWCLGDLVGYGPAPSECLRALREAGAFCISGNHDLAVAGEVSTAAFNAYAAAACEWTAAQLTAEETEWLRGLPPATEHEGCTLAHGSPRDPVWEYIVSPTEARENFPLITTPLCLIGHTHLPSVFPEGGKAELLTAGQTVDLSSAPRLILNPGSVGQPRDGDPRAAYALFDAAAGSIVHHRVEYDIPAVQTRMEAAGLPGYLISRLTRGR